MNKEELAGLIDQTLLDPSATQKEVEAFVTEAREYGFATVILPPCYVRLASGLLACSTTRVGTVVGFPLGYQARGVKAFEAKEAVSAGAWDVDMVLNVSALKSGSDAVVAEELARVAPMAPVLKVIIEACYLTEVELLRAVELVASSGADFVKTSTGFGPAGASPDMVRLLKKAARGRVKVKASGGIRTLADLRRMLEAGAERIGTSSGVAIMRELEQQG